MFRREYLKQKYPFQLSEMIQNGQLLEYLTDLDQRADRRYRFLIKEITKDEGLNNDMKRISPIQWRTAMKAVAEKVEESVKKEFVYSLPKV